MEVADNDAGLKMHCPGCGQALEVPAAAKAAVAQQAPAGNTPDAARPRLSATAAPDEGQVAIEDCPSCGKALQVPAADVSRRVACPRCGRTFVARKLGERDRDRDRDRDREEDEDRGKRRYRGRDDADDDEDRRRPARREREGERFCHSCGEPVDKRDRHCAECGAQQKEVRDPVMTDANSKKLAAGLCAILVGGFGVHKFILGYNTPGIIMLLVTLLTCGVGGLAMYVISIVEGITYLTRSDEDFYRTYIVGKKEWF
jgi:TM2 domain-containing membrane protein YozV/DNA-directed RNA polymerase subunit M/transcription elongation factor TFIIS